jgi:twinkle protein
MSMIVTDDDIDFDAYISGPDESANVRPASHWVEEVIDAFRTPPNCQGQPLPWLKTQDTVRLRRGEFSIWAGMSGHGKSQLVGQVMLSLMASGEKVCLASLEMKPAEVMQRMCRQAFACNAPSEREIRDFHRWTEGRFWIYEQKNEVSPDRILAVSRYAEERLSATHFMVDNLLSCGISEDGDGWQSRQKAFALALACHAHDTKQAVHLLAHVRKGKDELAPPSKFDVRGSASLTDLADNVFTIWRNKKKELSQEEGKSEKDNEADCLLTVEKNRHGFWEGRIKLWFNQGCQRYLGDPYEHPEPLSLSSENDEVEF